MNFYGHKGLYGLGNEPLGTEGRHIKKNLKTISGAIKHFHKWFNDEPFTLYAYTDFYDDRTFRLVYVNYYNKEVHYVTD